MNRYEFEDKISDYIDNQLSSSERKVFELKLNLPNWLQTNECLTRKTSKMSPEVLAKRGS